MATEANKDFDLDTLLDGTLDDLTDMPEFAPFPAGAHRAVMSWEILQGKKAVNGHPTIKLNIKGLETIELVDKENAKPISKDQETSVLFMMDNEMGQGSYKNVIAALKEHYGEGSNREIMEKSKDAEVLVVTNLRPNKDKTKMYTGIEGIKVL